MMAQSQSRTITHTVRAVAWVGEDGNIRIATQQQAGTKWGEKKNVGVIEAGRLEAARVKAESGKRTLFITRPTKLRSTVTIGSSSSSSSSSSSRSATPSASASVSGRGADVKQLRLSGGQHRCTFTVSGNGGRYGNGTNVIFKVGGRLQVNEIESRGSWTRLLDAGSGGTYYVEVDVYSSASWSVRCN